MHKQTNTEVCIPHIQLGDFCSLSCLYTFGDFIKRTITVILLSGQKNPDQRTDEKASRACPKHGQGMIFSLDFWTENFCIWKLTVLWFHFGSKQTQQTC